MIIKILSEKFTELNRAVFSPKTDSKGSITLDELLTFILIEFEKIFAEYLLISKDTSKDKHILKTNHCQFFKIKKTNFLIGIKSSSNNLAILFVCK